MKRELLRSIAVVGLLLWLPNSQQRAVAQALREPTLDDRFRGAGDKAPEAELPLLNPPQVKLNRENHEAANNSGPAYLGVTFSTQNRDAVVRTVTPGSPAAQAGLQPTDVIESVQGQPVRSYQDVLDIVAKLRPGDKLDVEFSRRMSVRTQAALTSLPAATPRSVGYPPDSPTEHELLPVPSNARRDAPAAGAPRNRRTAPQGQSGAASGQRRNNNQGSGQSDDNRGFLGRGMRRR